MQPRQRCWFRHYKGYTATPAEGKSKNEKKKEKAEAKAKVARSPSPSGSAKGEKKTRSQRRALSKRRARGEACVAVGGFVGVSLAVAIVGVGNALSLCTDAIAMKLESCTYAPAFEYKYVNETSYTAIADAVCETKQATCDVKSSGSDGQTLQYNHSINQNICTEYADPPACASGGC